jgi:hypothetical protein
MCKLLELPDYQNITSELKTTLKVELFLDFILCVRGFVRDVALTKIVSNSYFAMLVWRIVVSKMQTGRLEG